MFRQAFFISSLLILAFSLNSCIERYKPDIGKYDNLLVIDGNITNLPGPYTVRLSRSAPLNKSEFLPQTECELIISDNTGNSEVLLEVEPGVYQTMRSGIQGIAGRSYKISIQLADGNTYESDFEELKQAVELDSVYAKIEYREDETVDHTIAGYQFYLDTKKADTEVNYFFGVWKQLINISQITPFAGFTETHWSGFMPHGNITIAGRQIPFLIFMFLIRKV